MIETLLAGNNMFWNWSQRISARDKKRHGFYRASERRPDGREGHVELASVSIFVALFIIV